MWCSFWLCKRGVVYVAPKKRVRDSNDEEKGRSPARSSHVCVLTIEYQSQRRFVAVTL